MAGPFSDVPLRLKQVGMAALGEPGRSVFTAVLGSYGLSLTDDDIAEGQARLSRTLGGTGVKFEWGGRRFAGDRTLPRTRYFSVTDYAGSDQRTLLQEMSAYLLGSTYPGLITLFDSAAGGRRETWPGT